MPHADDAAGAADAPRDPFGPPLEPCECYCLHCHRTFMSDQIWLQRIVNRTDEMEGFWKCPTPNCDGAGFTFDLFPTDPDHPANAGWTYCDSDDEEYADDDVPGIGDGDLATVGEGAETDLFSRETANRPLAEEAEPYDPNEPDFALLDELAPDAGDAWKSAGRDAHLDDEASREMREREAAYDEPDRRPREITLPPHESMGEDDIPF